MAAMKSSRFGMSSGKRCWFGTLCKNAKRGRVNEEMISFSISPDYYTKNFEEIEKIGKGASGSVFACLSKVDGVKYAIKKIEFVAKDYHTVMREVRLLARLQHPNVISCFESWIEEGVDVKLDSGSSSSVTRTYSNASNESDGVAVSSVTSSSDSSISGLLESFEVLDCDPAYTLFIRMEFCPRTLESEIESGLSIEIGLAYARQLMAGLEHIHQNNVIHRDIWPKNLLIDSSGHLKIGDFGLAIDVEAGKPGVITSRVGHECYRAPEMVKGATITPMVDVYSAGMVTFQLLYPMRSKSQRRRTLLEIQRGACNAVDAFAVCKYLSVFLDEDPSRRNTAQEIILQGTLQHFVT